MACTFIPGRTSIPLHSGDFPLPDVAPAPLPRSPGPHGGGREGWQRFQSRSPAVRARGGALSGLFGSPERVPRPRDPVRDHPALTVLGCGRPRDESPRFLADRDSAGPRRVGMRPSFAGLAGGVGWGRTQPPGRARLGPRTSELRTPSSARIRTSDAPAGLEGLVVAGSPWADLARRCRAADAHPRLAPREPDVCTRRNWGTTFSRCYEFYYPGEVGLEFVCLRRGQDGTEEPLGHKLPFTSPLPPPFSFLRSPLN